MRLCPSYVLKAIKKYNKNLSLKWDALKHVWVVYHKNNTACMVYKHINGTPAVNIDVSELIQQLRECDSHNDEMNLRRKLWRQRRVDEKEKFQQTIINECKDESYNRADFIRRGSTPNPFIPPRMAV
jgi:hypothetical protein